MEEGEAAACWEWRSTSVKTVVVGMPRRVAVRWMRRAISPRLAIKRDVIGVVVGVIDWAKDDAACEMVLLLLLLADALDERRRRDAWRRGSRALAFVIERILTVD